MMQVLTYEDEVEPPLAALKKLRPDIELLEDFDPMDPAAFAHYGTLDAETLKGGYPGLIKSVKDRLAASPVAATLLKRTVRFLDRA
jgi:hypothetical protein